MRNFLPLLLISALLSALAFGGYGGGGYTVANSSSSISGLTASKALASDSSGKLATSAVTSTELGYVAGVTSALQTQIDAKAPTASPTFTTKTTHSYATATTVATFNASKELVSSPVTPTTLAFLDATSSVQTQIDTKAAKGANSDITSMTGVTSISHTGGTTIKGTNTSDSAAAGDVGEIISSVVGTGALVSSGGSGVFTNVTSIVLTAGDWDVTGSIYLNVNTATGGSICDGAVSSNSGNTTTDHVFPHNALRTFAPTSTADHYIAIPNYRVSLSAASTTYYVKAACTYSGGGTRYAGRISARRMR